MNGPHRENNESDERVAERLARVEAAGSGRNVAQDEKAHFQAQIQEFARLQPPGPSRPRLLGASAAARRTDGPAAADTSESKSASIVKRITIGTKQAKDAKRWQAIRPIDIVALGSLTTDLSNSLSRHYIPRDRKPLRGQCQQQIKLLIIDTGGTFGMDDVDGKLQVLTDHEVTTRLIPAMNNALAKELDTLRDYAKSDVSIGYTPVIGKRIDSSAASPMDWQRIANQIAVCYGAYDGFIVIHGTDTLGYTAAALSLLLINIQKPVILTGAQVSIFRGRTDASNNLIGACMIAAKRVRISDTHPSLGLPGVFVFFDGEVMQGTRVCKVHSQDFHAFEAPKVRVNIASFDGQKLHIDDRWIAALHEDIHKNASGHQKPIKLHKIDPNASVVVLRLYPGIDLRPILPALVQAGCRGIILQAFGAGNGPVDDSNGYENESNAKFLIPLLDVSKSGVTVAFVTECVAGSALSKYGTSLAMETQCFCQPHPTQEVRLPPVQVQGRCHSSPTPAHDPKFEKCVRRLVCCGDMTVEAAFAKLVVALGGRETLFAPPTLADVARIKDMMESNIKGELSPVV